MGRDPLGAGERRVSGRDWGDSPLKLEADFNKLDEFLSSKKSKVSLPDAPPLIVESTETVVKMTDSLNTDTPKSSNSTKDSGYLSEDNLLNK